MTDASAAAVAQVECQVPGVDRATIERALADNGNDVVAAICALLDAPPLPSAHPQLDEDDVRTTAPNQDTFRYLRDRYDALDRLAAEAYAAMHSK